MAEQRAESVKLKYSQPWGTGYPPVPRPPMPLTHNYLHTALYTPLHQCYITSDLLSIFFTG